MIETDLREIQNAIPKINDNRQYWFIRTEAGKYCDPFTINNLVSVGYEYITLRLLEQVFADAGENHIKKLKGLVMRFNPDEKRPGLVASQISKFYKDIKRGDVVIVPSEGTDYLYFGIVLDDKPFHVSYKDMELPKDKSHRDFTHNKARRVKWFKREHRSFLHPKMLSLFFSHQTISNGHAYAEYIDSTLNDFYFKNGKYHFQINIGREKSINAMDLFGGGVALLGMADDFMRLHGIDGDISSLEVKVMLESPGYLKLVGVALAPFAIIGGILIPVGGGNVKVTTPAGVNISVEAKGATDITDKVLNYLTEQKREERAMQILTDLQASAPKDFKAIIKKAQDRKIKDAENLILHKDGPKLKR